MASPLTIQPCDSDVRIYEPFGGANDNELIVDCNANSGRSLVRFDFAALPEESTISSAIFSMYYQAYGHSDPVGRTFNVYRLTQTNWTEAATWTLYNGTSSWIAAGGDYTATDGASDTVPASAGWMDWDVTEIVKWCKENAEYEASLIIKDSAENFDGIASFIASEAGGNTPKLVITYGTNYPLTAEVGEFALTGISVDFSKTLNMIASVGEFALTGITTTFSRGYNFVCSVGSFVLTGISSTLSRTGISWLNIDKNSISPANISKNSISPTNIAKNSSTFTNIDKS